MNDNTMKLEDYSAVSLERVQTSIAHCIVKNVAGAGDKDTLDGLLSMYADIENEQSRRAEELQQFIDSRG